MEESSPNLCEITDINDPRFDPFRRSDVPLSDSLEKIKTYILLVTLFPIRIFLLVFWLCVYAVFLIIGTTGRDISKPHNRFTRWCISGFLNIAKFSKFKLVDIMFLCFGFPAVVIKGDTSMFAETGERANIIVTNHVSYLDILAMMAYNETIPAFVSKKEVQKVPLFGWKSKIWQCIYVDRNAEKGMGVASQINTRATSFDYPPILVFPEGTTSNGKYVISFKTGAFIGGHPVKPVAIRYPSERFSPAWESITFGQHVFRLLTQVYSRLELTFMPVYVPTEAEKANPNLYANNVRKEIAKVLGVELRDSSFAEKSQYLKLIRNKAAEAKENKKTA